MHKTAAKGKGMSVSKIWSMVSGMERERRHESGEEFTYRYLGQIAKELDEATGYTKNGGRGEWKIPSEDSGKRFEHYKKTGEELKNRKVNGPVGTLCVCVTDADGSPLVAEVKLFPVATDVTEETFTYADFCSDFVRAYTEEDGCFVQEVETGCYLLEASKKELPERKIL